MNRNAIYLVKIPGDTHGAQYVCTFDRRTKVVTGTTIWSTDAARMTYNIALTVARRNNGRLKIVHP